jgi:hypothetical protein
MTTTQATALRVTALVKDIHAAITELADGATYPDLTAAIDELAALGVAATSAGAQPPQEPLKEGWKLVAVNAGFDDLMFWLNRCHSKGHLDNCFDLVEPWERFDWESPPLPSAKRVPLTEAAIEKLREQTFSTSNPFCPVDSKSMRKAVRAAEYAHGITESKEPGQ